MKKITSKGFTLIELLAVITIMGILMLVAIPAVSRTIENSRRNTMATTIKTYINAVRTSIIADEIKCGSDMVSGVADGTYYVNINGPEDWMQSGGTSSWGSATIKGYVVFVKTTDANNTVKYTYSAYLNDGTHGLNAETTEDNITRTAIKTTGATNPTAKTGTGVCTLSE